MAKKSEKNNKKILYASLVLLTIIIAGIFIYVQKTSNPALSECIKEWKTRQSEGLEPSKYVAGSVFVEFISNLTEQEARQLTQRYGLSILKINLLKDRNAYEAFLEVPVGSELTWLCKLKMHAFVSITSVIPKYD